MSAQRKAASPMAVGRGANNNVSSLDSIGNFPALPDGKTLHGLALALMIEGREISTPAFTYSDMHATRLPAYVHRLSRCGLPDGWIVSDALPLTERQRRRSHSKPFHRYWLKPEARAAMGDRGRQWAARTLEHWRGEGLRPERFKAAPAASESAKNGGG